MKILLLSPANNSHTEKWANELAKRGNEIHLAFNSDHRPINGHLDKHIILHKLKYRGRLGYFLNKRELRKVYRSIEPDVVNAHYASGYGTLARISKVKKLLLSVWGSDIYIYPYKSKFNLYNIRKNLRYADKIASTSYCMRDKILEVMEGEDIEIEITPFGVDMKKFCPQYMKKENERIIIGIVKALKPIYGIEYLIKAFKQVIEFREQEGESIEQLYLYIYGEGAERVKLEELVNRLNIENNVVFKGYIPNEDVPSAIQAMDIFCVPSLSESFGVAAIEAMACGIPVVGSDAEGLKEIIDDKITGYIVPKRDSKELANKLYDLIKNKNQRIEMGLLGRRKVEKIYKLEDTIDNMERIYKKMN